MTCMLWEILVGRSPTVPAALALQRDTCIGRLTDDECNRGGDADDKPLIPMPAATSLLLCLWMSTATILLFALAVLHILVR